MPKGKGAAMFWCLLQLGSVQLRSASQLSPDSSGQWDATDAVFKDNSGAENEWNWSRSFESVFPAVRRLLWFSCSVCTDKHGGSLWLDCANDSSWTGCATRFAFTLITLERPAHIRSFIRSCLLIAFQMKMLHSCYITCCKISSGF